MSDSTRVLGLNAFHGDSSAALLMGGDLIMAIEEERLNRIKHWAGLPVQAAAACVSAAGGGSVDHIAISRDPRANFVKKLFRVATRPSSIGHALNRGVNSARLARTKQDLQGPVSLR
jgi:carbamoyltransferase